VRVAVTGGSGFIGTAVRNELLRCGHDVINIDNRNGVDILGPDLASSVRECGSVIHLAGLLGTAELFDDAENAIDVNIKGTLGQCLSGD
jgi:nucleoside-diphosphate-sugar epimerase